MAAWAAHYAEAANRPAPRLCPICGGTARLVREGAELTGTHVRPNDVLVVCPTCSVEARLAWMRQHSGLEPWERERRPHHWQLPTLSDLEPEKARVLYAQRARARRAIDAAIGQRVGLFTFWGDLGSGKTLATQIILNELREAHHIEGYYAPFARILDHLRSLYRQGQDTGDYWQRLLDIPVLAIDEVTRFHDTDWAREQLFILADTRYRRRGSHLTVFLTNDDPNASLGAEDPVGYLFSRMREGTVVELRGDVRRLAGHTVIGTSRAERGVGTSPDDAGEWCIGCAPGET